jgi:subtilisin family serine protease
MPKSDDELHGTHVAGIIAAVRNNSLGMDGISSTA